MDSPVTAEPVYGAEVTVNREDKEPTIDIKEDPFRKHGFALSSTFISISFTAKHVHVLKFQTVYMR